MPTNKPGKRAVSYDTSVLRGSVKAVMPIEEQINATAKGIETGTNMLLEKLIEVGRKNPAIKSHEGFKSLNDYVAKARAECIGYQFDIDKNKETILASLKELDAGMQAKLKEFSSGKSVKAATSPEDHFPVSKLGKETVVETKKEIKQREKEENKLDKLVKKIGNLLSELYDKHHQPVVAPKIDHAVTPGHR